MAFPTHPDLSDWLVTCAVALSVALAASVGHRLVWTIVARLTDARPVLGNLIAGLQLALTQPLRLDDVIVIEGEWGRIEQIRASYVVVRIWDQRRLIVPLQWFIEHPLPNWTPSASELIGTVYLWVDYRLLLASLCAKLERLCADAPMRRNGIGGCAVWR